MSKLTLFDLARSIRDSIGEIDPDTGEFSDAYAESRELFKDKAIACVAYYKDETVNIAAAEAMVKQMQDKVRQKKERLDRFKTYMADCMRHTGISEIKHDSGLFGAKLYVGRDESLVIEEGAKFDDSLMNQPKPAEPNKAAIKQAIQDGQPIKGASIVKKDRLTIN